MVVLTLKNLQQQTFSVDIELSATVKALKEKVEKEKGSDYPAGGQKLIYAGKILQDDMTLDSYNIDDKKFLVIMVTKPKAAPPPAAASDTMEVADTEEATTETPADPVQPTAAAAAPTEASSTTTSSTTTSTTTTTSATTQSADTPVTQSGPTTQPSSGGSAGSAESLIVVGEEFNRMVENIMEMGYERTQVERALRASFNNPYTAVQYLVDGIPPNLEEPAGQPAGGGGGGGGGDESVSVEGEPDAEGDPLNFLRSQPQFEQMRQMIRSNPSLLDAFIQQIGQTNPQLLQAIQQNQEAFVRMLNEGGPGSGGSSTGSSGGTQGSGGGGGGGGGGSGGSGGGGGVGAPTAIFLSPQDRDAIDRLKALGNFPEDVVVQAYFACEKNENLAAEFLFSQTWD
ncbi:UV excision repair protein RAD23 homolog B-like [Eriocheir sinensis]|uniref:UV excision repair protein RAD23 homolog B-like n=1 Tax=Eriocheir sinensis TaxID=95602 RepID=UPI0021C7740F|nr:UV excision repair protein RAD23 homolog B-like [Eriocheir sinensis]